jgi:hypothetical protein
MSAKDKASPFMTKSLKAVRAGAISEPTAFFEAKPSDEKGLAAASERFAAVLRTAPVEETLRTGLRDFGHVLFSGDERLLWTTRFESDWHRYIGKLILHLRRTKA